MKYKKPKMIKILGVLPPVTVNFAQPATQTGEIKNQVDAKKAEH